jgi:hypothetical protein
MLRREFIVDRAGIATEANPEEVLRHMGISPQLSAAYDICEDAGFDMEQATPLLAAAEKDGQNPEEFARHICKLRRAARGVKDLGI